MYGWYLKAIGAVSGVGAIIVGAVSIPDSAALGAIGMAEGLAGDEHILATGAIWGFSHVQYCDSPGRPGSTPSLGGCGPKWSRR